MPRRVAVSSVKCCDQSGREGKAGPLKAIVRLPQFSQCLALLSNDDEEPLSCERRNEEQSCAPRCEGDVGVGKYADNGGVKGDPCDGDWPRCPGKSPN